MLISTYTTRSNEYCGLPHILIGTIQCNGKCNIEYGSEICKKANEITSNPIDIPIRTLVERCIRDIEESKSNPKTEIQAIIFGGKEPVLQIHDIIEFIRVLRGKKRHDLIVIYTGYTPSEIGTEINMLKKFDNILIKFGRYRPDKPRIYDAPLKMHLKSSNQYFERIENI